MKNGDVLTIRNPHSNLGIGKEIMLLEDADDTEYVKAYNLTDKMEFYADTEMLNEFYETKTKKDKKMKITVKNILKEYPKLNQQKLPPALSNEEFKFIRENIDLYGMDDDIDNFIDTFIKMINNNISYIPKTKAVTRTVTKKNSVIAGGKEARAYKLLVSLIPDIEKINSVTDDVREEGIYVVRKKSGFDKFVFECNFQESKFGIVLDIAQYFSQNGDLMSAPRIQVGFNSETKQLVPLSYESHNTIPQVYAEHYDFGSEVLSKDKKYKDTLDFMLVWLKNLNSQGFGGRIFNKKKKSEKIEVYDIVEIIDSGEYAFVYDTPEEDDSYGRYQVFASNSDSRTLHDYDIQLFVKAGKRWHKNDLLKVDFTEVEKKTGKDKRKFKAEINKVIRQGKRKAVAKKTDNSKKVGAVDLQVKIMKSFSLIANKYVPAKRVLNLYKRIEKAAAELLIRRTSKYAEEIKLIADKLKVIYNEDATSNEEIVYVGVIETFQDEIKLIANSEKQLASVALIKRFVGLVGKENKPSATRLLDAVSRSLASEKVSSQDIYFEKIKKIKTFLEDYIDGGSLRPTELQLRGLAGIAGTAVPQKKKRKHF